MKHNSFPAFTRTLLFISFGVILLCLIYFCFEGFVLDYVNRPNHQAAYFAAGAYSEELGLNTFEYDCIQKTYGLPTKRSQEKSATNPAVELICDEYQGFTVHYSEWMESNGSIVHFTYLILITGKEYRFGWLQIGIGSPKWLVRLAYLLDQKVDAEELAYSAEDYPCVDEGFYGEDWSRILFCYDDADKVVSMAYEPPAF